MSNDKEDKVYPYQFFTELEEEYSDLIDEKAHDKFFNDNTFLKEFKFEPNEKLLYLQYQNIKFTVFRVLLSFLPMILFVVLIFGIPSAILGAFDNGIFNVIISIIISVFGVVLLIVLIFTVISATSYRYIITDRRIFIGYTFGQRFGRTINFTNILDMIVRQGFLARIFNVGMVSLITGSNETPSVGQAMNAVRGSNNVKNVLMMTGFMNIKTPFRVKNLINRIVRYYDETTVYTPPLSVLPIKKPKIMYKDYLGLQPDEKVYKVYVKKTVSSIVTMLGAVFIIFIYLFQFLADLAADPQALQSLVVVLGSVLGGLIVFILIISRFHAKGFEYVVTDRRIIMFKRFISIRCRDAIMGKITEVSIFQMITGRAANFGMIKISTKGFENIALYKDLISIQGIADVPTEKDDIMNVVLHYQRGKLYSPFLELYDPEMFSN